MYITVVNEKLHAKPLIHISTRRAAFKDIKLILPQLWNWRMQTSEAINSEFLKCMHLVAFYQNLQSYITIITEAQFDSTLNNIKWAPSLTIQFPKVHFNIILHLSLLNAL
jgi:hypothetical protein